MNVWEPIRKRLHSDCKGMSWLEAAKYVMENWRQRRCREIAYRHCTDMARQVAWSEHYKQLRNSQ